jgi:hypothetical protein
MQKVQKVSRRVAIIQRQAEKLSWCNQTEAHKQATRVHKMIKYTRQGVRYSGDP